MSEWEIKETQNIETADVLWSGDGLPDVVNSVFVEKSYTTITFLDAPTEKLFNHEEVKVQVKP